MADSTSMSFETGHEEMIHDAQLDFYGKRIATASSDRTIKIFELQGKNKALLAELKGHTGPVWQVAWGHPKNGNLLASCSYDRKVCIWQEVSKNQWRCVYEDNQHKASVNAVSWAPHELNACMLASASADGTVSIHTLKNNRWEREAAFMAHPGGVNGVSWAPAVQSGSLIAQGNTPNTSPPLQKIVTGGCDNKIKIWYFNGTKGSWDQAHIIKEEKMMHRGWVRDVAWAPSLGLPGNTIASCSEDRTAIIWTEGKDKNFEPVKKIHCKDKVWRVSWSVMGNILAVASGSNNVTLWKQSVDETWQNLADMDEGLSNKPETKAATG
eukprot:CAMPEP_0114507884 /NCGR_PEP_ID=MMETSP0109-20121206/12272_1 /TAXON_ID=29199 /ORGANISM="Chlorarachnion reptans, Strain CCCM449" /LENGTH=324 /DNA_ID=CAMNT_0001686715 /DNA_START=325 /DNA_END=1299 /DNA_ORIENTATION=+